MPREVEESVDPILERAKKLRDKGQNYTLVYLNQLNVLKKEISQILSTLNLENEDHNSISQNLNKFMSFIEIDIVATFGTMNADAIFTSLVFDKVDEISPE